MESYTENAFLEYVKGRRSKNTYHMYVQGLKKFSEWYGKSVDAILNERREDVRSDDIMRKKRFAGKIEEFRASLIKEGYTSSSASTFTQGITACFAYYEMPVKISGESSHRVLTTKDVVPRVDQYAAMYRVADNLRDRLIVMLGLNLAWRIGDVITLKRSDLPNLEQQTPIPFERVTAKEGVLAKTFLSNETVSLLREYLTTTKDSKNPYLFPIEEKESEAYINASTVNRTLKMLAEKAGVQIPSGKRVRFHSFRKRFLSECANLRIDPNIAKILTGKSVEPSMLTYLSEVDLQESFLKVSDRLRLTEKKVSVITSEDTSVLKARVEKLEKLVHGIAALNPNIVKDAAKMLNMSEWDLTMTYKTIEEILEAVDKKKWEEQAKEYEKMKAENGNGDNGNGD